MGKILNLVNFVTFKELWQKSAFVKIAAQLLEAGDFLSIFVRFSYKNFAHKKKCKAGKKIFLKKETKLWSVSAKFLVHSSAGL